MLIEQAHFLVFFSVSGLNMKKLIYFEFYSEDFECFREDRTKRCKCSGIFVLEPIHNQLL